MYINIDHENKTSLSTRDGHIFVERTKFLRTNEIFREQGCCSEKNAQWTNEIKNYVFF